MNKIEELIEVIFSDLTVEQRNNQINKILNKGFNQTDLEQFKKDIENAILAGTLHPNSDLGRIFLNNLFKKYGIV